MLARLMMLSMVTSLPGALQVTQESPGGPAHMGQKTWGQLLRKLHLESPSPPASLSDDSAQFEHQNIAC